MYITNTEVEDTDNSKEAILSGLKDALFAMDNLYAHFINVLRHHQIRVTACIENIRNINAIYRNAINDFIITNDNIAMT
jgi:hypothetical protein